MDLSVQPQQDADFSFFKKFNPKYLFFRSTKTRGTLISSAAWYENISSVVINFNKEVIVTRIGFAHFNFPTFLADLGGSIGLWLGLGVVQLLELIIKLLMKK